MGVSLWWPDASYLLDGIIDTRQADSGSCSIYDEIQSKIQSRSFKSFTEEKICAFRDHCYSSDLLIFTLVGEKYV